MLVPCLAFAGGVLVGVSLLWMAISAIDKIERAERVRREFRAGDLAS